MAKITREFQKQFGVNGGSSDFGKFGSLADGTPTYATTPSDMQSLAHFLTGLAGSTIGDRIPALEDLNSVFYLAFYQICYLLQQGVAEYDASTTYYTNSICQSGGVLYKSLQDSNTGQTPASSPTWWRKLLGNGADFFNLNLIDPSAGVIPEANLPTPVTPTQYVSGTYDSGWFAISAGNKYTKTHGLGTTKCLIQLMVASDASGTDMRTINYSDTGSGGQMSGPIGARLNTSTIDFAVPYYRIDRADYGYPYSPALAGANYGRIVLVALT